MIRFIGKLIKIERFLVHENIKAKEKDRNNMYFRGFKIAITVNFVILLLIGMMLTNVVITYFWQQYAVNHAIGNIRTHLSSLTSRSDIYCKDIDYLQSFLGSRETAQQKAGYSSVSLAMLRNDIVVTADDRIDKDTLALPLRRAVKDQSEKIESIGNYLSLFGLSARDLIVAVPAHHCEELQAIGMVIHLPSVLQKVHNYQTAILVYILINIVILATLWFFRARRLVFTPLEKLVSMSESFGIAESDFIGPVSKKNEFGQLADALRNMLARIETDKKKLTQTVESLEEANKQILENQASLVEAEKFAAVGRLSAGLAHEIGNPLGIIQGYVDLLGRNDVSEEERLQYQERASKELNRVTALIQKLLDLARKKKEVKEKTLVQPVIQEVMEMLRQQKTNKDVSFVTECDEFDEKVRCNEAELHQVLLNCILNSVDAIHEQKNNEGMIIVSCKIIAEQDNKIVKIAIKDNGKGIDNSILSSVFDPFFTTKKIGYGTGLGLSVSRSIIENSGGEMLVQSEVEQGTVVTLTLPVS